ncbi:unnamed protein product [Heterobilharzia americana]|nr:unnamed protein product [Heterobilharzia americana]
MDFTRHQDTKNQIYFISILRKWRCSLLDTRSRRGADVGSDHYPVQGTFQIKLKAFKEAGDRPQFKYNTRKLKDETTKEIFTSTIKTKREISRNIPEETCVNEHRNSLKEMWKETCIPVSGRKKKEDKEWISTDTWKLIEERRMVDQKINQCKDAQRQEELSTIYKTLDKEVKKSARKDKRHFYETLASEAEQATGRRDLTTLHQITRLLSRKRSTHGNQ